MDLWIVKTAKRVEPRSRQSVPSLVAKICTRGGIFLSHRKLRNLHSIARGWQNKQIGREFKTILSGHLFILHRLVSIGKSFAIM